MQREDPMFVPGYRPEYIFSYTAQVRLPPEVIGPTPDGIRANFYVTGGDVDGPKLKGKIVPVGADWLLIRRDGVAILDVRATIETHDGALIYVPYSGVADLGPDGYNNFLSGNLPQRATIRAVPRFHTSHPSYLWINRLQCLNVGDVDLTTGLVRYDVYAA
jgi:hypothetical protein